LVDFRAPGGRECDRRIIADACSGVESLSRAVPQGPFRQRRALCGSQPYSRRHALHVRLRQRRALRGSQPYSRRHALHVRHTPVAVHYTCVFGSAARFAGCAVPGQSRRQVAALFGVWLSSVVRSGPGRSRWGGRGRGVARPSAAPAFEPLAPINHSKRKSPLEGHK